MRKQKKEKQYHDVYLPGVAGWLISPWTVGEKTLRELKKSGERIRSKPKRSKKPPVAI